MEERMDDILDIITNRIAGSVAGVSSAFSVYNENQLVEWTGLLGGSSYSILPILAVIDSDINYAFAQTLYQSSPYITVIGTISEIIVGEDLVRWGIYGTTATIDSQVVPMVSDYIHNYFPPLVELAGEHANTMSSYIPQAFL
jgi:hypothetical protein